MACKFSTEQIRKTIEFHGHSCPGLAIGMRAAEYCLTSFPDADPTALVCVTETDMCGVDGIQYLTGCTFGKGNLIHRDYGKMAFSFFDRTTNEGFRLVFSYTTEGAGKEDMIKCVMETDLSELFTRQELHSGAPRSARVLTGMICESCGERTMESRTRRYRGQTLCIPCFRQVDQKA
ncbi:FmdE family protein [Desulfopila sp. IMCC35008]|uniref:FmdE family protein n=1 Tax=Desulfopila sp. IMCC35008 TaxID=2653858 RepID=UPI0013D611F6|nr:FmdE family protein [Desulfopila sp. IMCC35008]